MSVSTTATSITYPGNGATVDLPVPFRFLDAADLVVELVDAYGAVTTRTLTLHYTVEQTPSGGTVTMLTPTATGTSTRIRRATPKTQPDSIRIGGAFSPALVEDMADRAVLQLQELDAGKLPMPPVMTPLAPVVINAAGTGTEAGSTALTGDLLLRGALADGVTAGKGAELVQVDGARNLRQWIAYLLTGTGAALVGVLQSGAGAITRLVQDKLRERITPEDFGAVGDGTSRPVSQWLAGGARDRGYANLAAIQAAYPHVTALTDELDWAALQAAVNAAKASGRKVRALGHYAVNQTTVIDGPARLLGDAWGDENTSANPNPASVKGSRLTATAAMGEMIRVKSDVAQSYIRGVEVSGLFLNAAGLATKCLYVSLADKCRFSDLLGYAATTAGFDFSDDNGAGAAICFDNKIDRIYYNWNSAVAATSSVGFQFRDGGGGGGGMVQNEVGRVYTLTKNGHGIIIAGADNNNFYSLGGFISAGGTGKSVVFSNGLSGAPLPGRNNQVHYLAGSVQFESNTYGNRIHRMTSETASVVDATGGKNFWTVFDYNSAYTTEYTHEPSIWTDVLTIPVGGLQPFSGAVLGLAVGSVPVWDLADAATQGVGAAVLAPKRWGLSGKVKAVTVCYTCAAGGGGNVRLQVSGAAVGNGVALTDTTTEAFTDTVITGIGYLRKVTYTFTTPIPWAAGKLIHIAVQRLGADAADTYAGALRIASIGIHYTNDGPRNPVIPGWGVTDPTI